MVGQRLVNARRDAVELYVRDKADVVRRIEFNENKYQQEIEEKRKIGIEFVMTQVSTRTLGGPSLFLEFTHTHTLTFDLSLYHTYPLPLSSSSSSLFFLLTPLPLFLYLFVGGRWCSVDVMAGETVQ